jgi:hypothetical protein
MAWSGAQVEGNADQSGMAALTFEAGDMLRRGTAGLADELGKAGLMHAMPTGWIDADCANMFHTLDQAEHRGRLCRFRHLAQPYEPALTRFRAALRQSIEPAPLLGRQRAGQPPFDLSSRLIAQLDAEAFERPGWWGGDPALPAFLHNQLGQVSQPVILNRVRQQPAGQFGGRTPAEGAKPEPVLQFCGMTPTVLLGAEIVVYGFWPNIDLPGDKRDQRRRRSLADTQRPPRMAEVAKHQRVAEAAVIAPAPPDYCDICLG